VGAVQLDLENRADSPARARRAVAELVGDRPRTDELLLCVSEVVTNAVLHARSAPRLFVTEEDGHVRVEVSDDDPALPVRKNYDQLSPTGRGLHLLDRLTSGWGAEARSVGKVVWFVFLLDGEPT
jgi:anti-sigma regulatory factor (Ser/Thr protein kinase)